MSSWKNAVQRREHRERAQPRARAGLGLLEKHKDYKLRAKNFHSKEKRLASMRGKAALRNPDEFYFRMVSTETKVRGRVGTFGSGLPDATFDGCRVSSSFRVASIMHCETRRGIHRKKC